MNSSVIHYRKPALEPTPKYVARLDESRTSWSASGSKLLTILRSENWNLITVSASSMDTSRAENADKFIKHAAGTRWEPPAATVPAATDAFPSFIYNSGEERSPNLLKLKKKKNESCYESYPEEWGQLCVKVDQESNLQCVYFGFSIFSCNNKQFTFNCTLLSLHLHVVCVTTEAFIIPWEELFYFLFVSDRFPLSVIMLHLAITFQFVAPVFWFSAVNNHQSLPYELPLYNQNQCRLFSHEINDMYISTCCGLNDWVSIPGGRRFSTTGFRCFAVSHSNYSRSMVGLADVSEEPTISVSRLEGEISKDFYNTQHVLPRQLQQM